MVTNERWMVNIGWWLAAAFAGMLVVTVTHPSVRCSFREGYVYVVDSRACVPFGALVPAVEPAR